jgi:cobalamin synthase
MKQLFSKDNRSDIIIGIIVVSCLLLSSTVLASFMPSSLVMVAVAIFVAAISLFVVVIWRENPRDEREAHILLSSDRLGFLAGAVVLSLGLVVQSLRHESTNVLALALTAMILGKLFGKYFQK